MPFEIIPIRLIGHCENGAIESPFCALMERKIIMWWIFYTHENMKNCNKFAEKWKNIVRSIRVLSKQDRENRLSYVIFLCLILYVIHRANTFRKMSEEVDWMPYNWKCTIIYIKNEKWCLRYKSSPFARPLADENILYLIYHSVHWTLLSTVHYQTISTNCKSIHKYGMFLNAWLFLHTNSTQR